VNSAPGSHVFNDVLCWSQFVRGRWNMPSVSATAQSTKSAHPRPTPRWLAQIVRQIIKAVGWENEFKCEGVARLTDFMALVNELGAMDPVSLAVRSSNRRPYGWVPQQLEPPNVVRLSGKLGALLDLLGATADGLEAAWDQLEETTAAETEF
jgi:hypothetical protein